MRLWELSWFYEEIFGHVPVAEINAAWFQYIMHPSYRTVAPASKRALDIVVVADRRRRRRRRSSAPRAARIKRDGGPVFFKQMRIGEGGRRSRCSSCAR